jgi:oligoribonuclease (3'-5' exoribonuclease)
MKILIIDLETTGLDPNDGAEVIEAAAILYDAENKGILAQIATLFPVFENKAQSVNHIPAKLSQQMSQWCFWSVIQNWIDQSTGVAAFNSHFDFNWIRQLKLIEHLPPEKCFCFYRDFEWPQNQKACKLVETALNHGVPVTTCHRALADCSLVAATLEKIDDLPRRLNEAMKRSQEPILEIEALVDYESRNLAKSEGFYWNPSKRSWLKDIPESEFANLNYPFRTKILTRKNFRIAAQKS